MTTNAVSIPKEDAEALFEGDSVNNYVQILCMQTDDCIYDGMEAEYWALVIKDQYGNYWRTYRELITEEPQEGHGDWDKFTHITFTQVWPHKVIKTVYKSRPPNDPLEIEYDSK